MTNLSTHGEGIATLLDNFLRAAEELFNEAQRDKESIVLLFGSTARYHKLKSLCHEIQSWEDFQRKHPDPSLFYASHPNTQVTRQ